MSHYVDKRGGAVKTTGNPQPPQVKRSEDCDSKSSMGSRRATRAASGASRRLSAAGRSKESTNEPAQQRHGPKTKEELRPFRFSVP
jgi:hypothetical protein